MEINDGYIKSMISAYKETGEHLGEILEHLSLFIYYFPKLVTYSCKDDVFGEYYEYFIERLPKLLYSYTVVPGTLFKTWFYIVQKRHYLNFLKTQARPTANNNCDYLEPEILDTIGIPVESNLSIKDVAPQISEDDLLFLKLFTPENLSRQDFQALMQMLDCDMDTLMIRLRLIFEYPNTKERRKNIRIVPINRVADFLGWNRLKVSKKLNKIREKIQKTYTWEE